MSARGICGRADLLRALATGDSALVAAMADLLDLEPPVMDEEKKTGSTTFPDDTDIDVISDPEPEPEAQPERVLAPVPFWRVQAYDRLSSEISEEPALIGEPVEWSDRPDPAQYPPLSSWQHLQPRLRGAIAAQQPGGSIDWDKLVRWIGCGRLVEVLPRRRRRGWGPRVQIVEDRSTRLTPYWRDQAMVRNELARLFPDYAIEYHTLRDSSSARTGGGNTVALKSQLTPPEGGLVLVMSDLGALAQDGGRAIRFWQRMGKAWGDAGCHLLALVPTDTTNVPASLRQCFQPLAWEHRRQSDAPGMSLDMQAEALLCRVSPALRIEPGFLRAVRQAMRYDPGAESLVWQHASIVSTHSEAASLDPERAKALRKAFINVPLIERQAVLRHLREWHAPLGREIWLEEVVSLPPEVRDALPEPSEYPLACRFFTRFSEQGRGKVPERLSAAQSAWFARTARRLPDTSWRDSAVGPSLQRLKDHLHRADPALHDNTHLDPSVIAADDDPIGRVAVSLKGKCVCFQRSDAEGKTQASPLALMPSYNGLFRIEALSESVDASAFWQSGKAPGWAEHWGHDTYGAWVSLRIQGIAVRLRWLPPGEFLMGSPTEEAGRFDEEGPRHQVRISQGYWLAETPVTQTLWEAVMGENPSDFISPTRPVERVSFEDCERFIDRLNRQQVGLQLTLPSEAQWEYACRAGSEFATYAGEMEILGKRNAPVLDAIAWYGGNSGVDFDLDTGFDSRDWTEKQYPHEQAGTHPVKLKQPNAWGLYDTLGNVCEWCADGQRAYTYVAAKDPLGPQKTGGARIVRGGSWSLDARHVRCATRLAYEPGIRLGDLGVRLSRVQDEAIPVSSAPIRARQRTAVVSSGAADVVDLRDQQRADVPLPMGSSRFMIKGDRAEISVFCNTRPEWAVAMGRDRFGLWAEFEVTDQSDSASIQRLRWIPPGDFLMGSPEEEPERSDDESLHSVTLTQGYWLAETACTQALWEAVTGENPSHFQGTDRPVEQVSWEQVKQFIVQLNKAVPGLEARLPSEAEWEYAARAGSRTPFWWGSTLSPEQANFDGSVPYADGEAGKYREETVSVRAFEPNPWGLYQVHGNVWEWCEDWDGEYESDPVVNPQGPESGARRVCRGGSWDYGGRYLRSAYRFHVVPAGRSYDLGFRLCAGQSGAEPR